MKFRIYQDINEVCLNTRERAIQVTDEDLVVAQRLIVFLLGNASEAQEINFILLRHRLEQAGTIEEIQKVVDTALSAVCMIFQSVLGENIVEELPALCNLASRLQEITSDSNNDPRDVRDQCLLDDLTNHRSHINKTVTLHLPNWTRTVHITSLDKTWASLFLDYMEQMGDINLEINRKELQSRLKLNHFLQDRRVMFKFLENFWEHIPDIDEFSINELDLIQAELTSFEVTCKNIQVDFSTLQ